MAKELWELAKRPGQPAIFKSSGELWDKAVGYFEWCGTNVMLEEKVGFFQGDPTSAFVAHKRPMTQNGLCVFLGISEQTYRNYREKDEFFEVCSTIDSIMFEQKFSGASVGLFNANIIARDLGLSDKQEVKVDNGSVTPWSDIAEE